MKKLIWFAILIALPLTTKEITYKTKETEYKQSYIKLKKIYTKNKQTQEEFDKLINYIKQESKKNELNPTLILSTIGRESGFDVNAKGIDGDRGLCQFTQQAAQYHNIKYDSLFNPYYSIDACILRYKDIFNRFKCDTTSAIVAYGFYKNINVKNKEKMRAVIRFNKHKEIINARQ